MGELEPSPVPSDARLWPDELPFTAFGQFGVDHLDLRVYDQDTWWVDRFGQPHLLDEMPFTYQANVVMFLREQAADHHLATVVRATIQQAGDALLGLEPLEYLDPQALAAMTARQWQESTPLMRRLLALTGAR